MACSVAPVGLGTQAVLAPALGWPIFLFQHGLHQVGHGPHAFADLCLAAQTAGQTHQHVVELVGLDPGAALHVALADHGAGQHGAVHLVTGAVEETGVDEGHPALGGGDASLEVDAGATLFVHDAQLDGAGRQAQHALDAGEQLVGKSHLGWAVHLGLDDVDRALARVADLVLGRALEVMHGDGGGDHRVQNAFGNFTLLALCVGVEDGRVGHQVPDIAHEHQRAAVQPNLAFAGRRGVNTISVQAAREGGAALAHLFGERALQDAQPVGVRQHLVLGIDHGHRVFQVQDGRQRRFHHQVTHTCRVTRANRRAAVDADVQMQAVVHQQHRARRGGLALVAHQLRRLGQRGLAAVLEFDAELAVLDAVAHGINV